MTMLREAAQQALGFTLRDFKSLRDFEAARAVLHDALRDALAQEEREPVAMCRTWHKGSDQHAELLEWSDALEALPDGEHLLYAHPPRREWQGLTREEINDGRNQLPTEDLCSWSFRQGVYFAEKALKEKNHG